MDLKLYSLHRLLIRAAILLGALLGVYGVAGYVRAHNGGALATGIGGALACVVLALYLRWFTKR